MDEYKFDHHFETHFSFNDSQHTFEPSNDENVENSENNNNKHKTTKNDIPVYVVPSEAEVRVETETRDLKFGFDNIIASEGHQKLYFSTHQELSDDHVKLEKEASNNNHEEEDLQGELKLNVVGVNTTLTTKSTESKIQIKQTSTQMAAVKTIAIPALVNVETR